MDSNKKLYVVKLKDNEPYIESERNRIGRKMLFIASAINEDIYFHDDYDIKGGGTALIVEASEKFISLVPVEYFVDSIALADPSLKSARSSTLRKQFEDAAPPPPPPRSLDEDTPSRAPASPPPPGRGR